MIRTVLIKVSRVGSRIYRRLAHHFCRNVRRSFVRPDDAMVRSESCREEMNEKDFHMKCGYGDHEIVDMDLFEDKKNKTHGSSKKKRKSWKDVPVVVQEEKSEVVNQSQTGDPENAETTGEEMEAGKTEMKESTSISTSRKSGSGGGENTRMYYRVTCRDNGRGMPHESIPDMLGIVLSGTKYSVRQTRGKFGLGAKMALIWAKKSTGLPIEVKSTVTTNRILKSSKRHGGVPASDESNLETQPFVSWYKLDIDIYKNRPRIVWEQKIPKKSVSAAADAAAADDDDDDESSCHTNWQGTEITVFVGGNWRTYRSRILQYLQQLAIITPYAEINFSFVCVSDPSKSFKSQYMRRSNQMPPLAREVKHHPSSVNNLMMRRLCDRTNQKNLLRFLIYDLANIDKTLGLRIINELKSTGIDENTVPSSLNTEQIHRLTQCLRDVSLFRPPDGSCLSPAGEYNLRLGIIKEMNPDFVATHTSKASAYEGHPFVVEAGVAVGGKDAKVGVSVHRFANRIPLLFEGGADVVTRTANTKINYRIDQKKDKIGVFVSIVSTKIPFKGTGKEYIGDDVEEIQRAVKSSLQSCCQQLRVELGKKQALKQERERRKNLERYIPDVSNALLGIVKEMYDQAKATKQLMESSSGIKLGSKATFSAEKKRILEAYGCKKLTAKEIAECLEKSVCEYDKMESLERSKATIDEHHEERQEIYVNPIGKVGALSPAMYHESFAFRLLL